MISRPPQLEVNLPDGMTADSMAMTKDAISPAMVPPPRVGPSDATDTGGLDEYALAPLPNVPASLAEGDAFGDTEQFAAVREGDAEQVDFVSDDKPLLPSDEWTSESSAKRRQLLFVSLVGFASVLVCVVGFLGFRSWYATTASDPQQEQVSGMGLPTDAAADMDSNVVGANNDAGNDPNIAANNLASNTNPNVPTNAELDADPTQTPTDPVEPSTNVGDGELSTSPSVDTLVDGGPAPLIESPLDLPEGMTGDVADVNSGDASMSTAANSVKQTLPNSELQSYAPMLDYQIMPTLPIDNFLTSTPPITAEDLGLSEDGGSDSEPALDWGQVSQTVVPGLAVSEPQPLSQIINLWVQFSGVPSVVDLDSLAAANLDRNQAVAIGKLQSATLDSVARHLAEKAELGSSWKSEGFLEFRAAPERLQATVPQQYSLAELVVGEDDQSWLQSSLVALIPGSDGAWSVEAQILKPDLRQVNLMQWFQVVRMLENWRVARGAAREVQSYSNKALAQPFVQEASFPALQQNLMLPLADDQPAGQLLTRACRSLGVHCWIDWANVGRNDFTPKTETLVLAYDRPLKNFLADFAEQFQLKFALVDSETLILTTNRAYRAAPQLYVLESEGLTAEQMTQRLGIDLTPATTDGVVERVQVIATPDGKHFLVRCCRPTLAALR